MTELDDPSKSPLNIGIVGLGSMGALHAAIARALPGVALSAAIDSDERLLKLLSRVLPEISVFTEIDEIGTLDRLDAIYICTPPNTHHELAIRAQRAVPGIAVFVEKPMVTRSRDGADLARRSIESKAVTMVGLQKRYVGTFKRAKEILDGGGIGNPVYFRSQTFTAGVLETGSGWKFEPGTGGVLLDWGVHLVDLLYWFFGSMRVREAVRRRIFSANVEDYVHATLQSDSGVTGSFEAGWSMRTHRSTELTLEIHGTRGALRVNEDQLTTYLDSPYEEFPAHPYSRHVHALTPRIPYLLGQPENVLQEIAFLDSVRLRRPPPTSFANVAPIHLLMDSISEFPLERP